jgi:Na+/proline symporter
MQRVLSARSPREAALMSGLVNVVLLFPRYMLITGLTVLALVYLRDELAGMGDRVDFDLILPLTMRQFIPVGLFGLLLAALLAAFMSTYAATVNAAPAYVVNDIYKRYVNPHASDRTYVLMSYATTIAVVIVGTAVGFIARYRFFTSSYSGSGPGLMTLGSSAHCVRSLLLTMLWIL